MNFRRWITALAVLAIFAGVASAQFTQLAPVNCSVSVAATPAARSEGLSEKVGDILISCGNSTTAPTNGSAVDRGRLLVDFGAAITSRADTAVANVGKPSEIVLLFDEPGMNNGPVTGYGQNSPAIVCTAANGQADEALILAAGPTGNENAATNCRATLYNVVNAVGSYWVLDSGAAVVPPAVFAPAGQAANVYQGAIGGAVTGVTGYTHTANQVLFYDVPILPSGAGNLTHLFRITNVRLTPGAVANITATLTPTSYSVGGNPVTGARWQYQFSGSPIVATVAPSIGTTMTSLAQSKCISTALVPTPGSTFKPNLALVSFRENSAGSFKTRVLPLDNAAGGAMGSVAAIAAQIKPNGAYTVGTTNLSIATSESGYILPNVAAPAGLPVSGTSAGLATTGTRLKAVFTGLDANAQYYASLGPVTDYATPVTLANPGDATQTEFAVLQATGTAGAAASETAAFAPAVSVGNANGTVPVAQITRSTTGTGQVTWEVTNTNPGAPQTLTFAIYVVYSNTTNPPAEGNTATINLGFAPTTASSGAAATAIPRFTALASGNAQTFFNVLPCQTVLMFPYVTTIAGYETGISIANTSKDQFGTPQTNGVCNLTFYGANQPAAPMPLWDPAVADGSAKTINAGAMIANTATNILNPPGTATPITNFNGYAIAVCNFRFAHGFAFVQNRAQTLGMGYLPLVIDTTNSASNGARGSAILGESFNQ